MDFGFDLRYYLLLLRRRLFYILIPFFVVLAACLAVSLLVTPTYRASGTILVEAQQIPDDLVRSTIVNAAGERIGIIKQRVMRRANLVRIAEEYGLFPQKEMSGDATAVIEAINKAVTVEPVKDDVAPTKRGAANMVFSVSFDHANPDTAYAVANDLISLFLQENVRNRTKRAAETTAFLSQEAHKLKSQVDSIEARIARFKEQNRSSLPELQNTTIAYLERARTSLEDTNQAIETAQAERRLLSIQLAAAKSGLSIVKGPFSTQGDRLTPLQELEELQSELIEKSAVYDPSHPDIVSLRRRIASLKRQYGVELSQSEFAKRLYDLRSELKDAEGRYAKDHPDVRRIRSEIQIVEAQMASRPRENGSGAAATKFADPIYAHVQAQIEAADDRLQSLRTQQGRLKKRISDLETTIDRAPMVERDLNALNRDYSTAVRKYQEIKAKEIEAQLAQNLEADKQAERLTLLDAPVRPNSPIKPNRLKILAYGLALALAAGGGGFLFAEAMDSSIRGAVGYRTVMKSSPYVVIPYIATTAEVRRQQALRTATIIGVAIAGIIAVLLVHFFIKPLDDAVLGIVGRLA